MTTIFGYNRPGSHDLNAFVATTGTEVDYVTGTGVTLANSTTYYVPLGDDAAPVPAETSLQSVHMKWDTAVNAVVTIETTNFPLRRTGNWIGSGDVTDWDATKGNWIQENPSSGVYISVTSTDGTTGGATVSASTITIAGGTAGGSMVHVGNLGSRRVRLKVVVTTGGVMRFCVNGKNAA